MDHSPDYYSVLGVDPTADRVTVHSAWKALLRRYHPDANHGVDVSARAKEINEAYAVLGKEDARAAYDRSRPPPSSPRQPDARRPGQSAAGRRPMRPGPSLRPSNPVPPPLDASQWMMGFLLLLLSAAPLGMILVLHYEETGSQYADRRGAAVHRGSDMPVGPGRISPGAKLKPAPPAS